jgi:hypothetical protein
MTAFFARKSWTQNLLPFIQGRSETLTYPSKGSPFQQRPRQRHDDITRRVYRITPFAVPQNGFGSSATSAAPATSRAKPRLTLPNRLDESAIAGTGSPDPCGTAFLSSASIHRPHEKDGELGQMDACQHPFAENWVNHRSVAVFDRETWAEVEPLTTSGRFFPRCCDPGIC